MSKISFILHGKLKGSKLVSHIQNTFSNLYEVVFYFTEFSGHASELARHASLSNSTYIISTGGDGTLNEVVNGVMLSGNKEVKVGLLPYGTGNDFAKTIRVSQNIQELKKLIESNSVSEIDLGFVNYKNTQAQNIARYFINITDVGIGGSIAVKLFGSSKWMGAFLTFQKAIVTTFFTYKHQPVKISADSFSYEGKILSCIVANGKYFGGGMGIAPAAVPNDGFLEIVLASEISLWDYLRHFGKIRACQKINHPHVSYHQAKEILIESPLNLPIDMDGEFAGYTSMKISVAPKAIQFICPQ